MYSPDGQYEWNGSAWIPRAPAPPPPPPTSATYAQPPRPPAYTQPPGPSNAFVQQQAAYANAPQVQQQPWQAPAMPGSNDDLGSAFPQGLDFNDPSIVGAASIPEGDWVARFDDFEYGQSQATPPNPKVSVKVTITTGQYANRSGVYSYTLTEKSIFRLGKDLQKLNLGLRSNGQRWSADPRTLAGELQQELRGKLVKLRSVPQIDKTTKLPSSEGYVNVTLLGWPDAPQNSASTAGMPTQAPPSMQMGPANGMPQVTYPPAPPSNAPGFHNV